MVHPKHTTHALMEGLAVDRPTAPSLVSEGLYYRAIDTGDVSQFHNEQWVLRYSAGGGGGTPGGSDKQVQFNDGGSAFGGDAGFTYDKTTGLLTLNGDLAIGATPAASGALRLSNSIGGAIRLRDADDTGDLFGLYANANYITIGNDTETANADGALQQIPNAAAGDSGGSLFFSGGRGKDGNVGVSGGTGGEARFSGGNGGDAVGNDAGWGGALLFQAGNAGVSDTGAGGKGGDLTLGAGNGGNGNTGGNGSRLFLNAGVKGNPGGSDGYVEVSGPFLIDNTISTFGLPTSDPHVAGDVWSAGFADINALDTYLQAGGKLLALSSG